eukprot:TRINITY_DN8294_c0_g1_i2.p1 TRINITY_DN8294_c0_g1~~TRINITY_DN8294_c0_g1_i2.p1  ORF type:complete len:152 (+),score=21.60 TRINITY_DN8294_c0_g1_i2:23-478(+)
MYVSLCSAWFVVSSLSVILFFFFFFFFNDTATTEIYTLHIVGSVRCVQETDQILYPQIYTNICTYRYISSIDQLMLIMTTFTLFYFIIIMFSYRQQNIYQQNKKIIQCQNHSFVLRQYANIVEIIPLTNFSPAPQQIRQSTFFISHNNASQ